MGRSWLHLLDVWGERLLRGRFAQQFAALFYKNGELQGDAAQHWNGRQKHYSSSALIRLYVTYTKHMRGFENLHSFEK
jgi:hypothetical protein